MGGFDNNLVNNYYSDHSGDGSMQDVCECMCVCMCENICFMDLFSQSKKTLFTWRPSPSYRRSGNFYVTNLSYYDKFLCKKFRRDDPSPR